MTVEEIVAQYQERRRQFGDDDAWSWFKTELNAYETGIIDKQPLVHDINDFDRMLEKKVDYHTTSYPALDRIVKFPVGDRPIIIAGLSSHGKTSIMLDMVENLTRVDMSGRYLYLPYEATWGKTAVRMLYTRYCKEHYSHGKEILSWQDWYILARRPGWVRDYCREQYVKIVQKVILRDGNYTAEKLALIMRRYAQTFTDLKGIFIDYLQIMPVYESDVARQVRQAQLKYIMDVARDIGQSNGIFVVLGSQITEPEYAREKKQVLQPRHLREAKDIYYSASVVLGIWNETKFQADTQGIDIENVQIHDVEIDIIKNADGPSKRGVKFSFFAPYGFLVEKPQHEQEAF